ncbi:hypothetical protein DL93DRAFT_2228080 [Clavulina sp. PMI_390]|nr:hypothetical protein DL93DRAFT_2228080 [Clavulina sp. PMI_390]
MSISLLPREVLLLVIENVLLGKGKKDTAVWESFVDLLTLTALDSFWRNLIIGYSPFWTEIHIKIPPSRYIRPETPTRILASDLERVGCFLRRSNHSSIDLHIVRSWLDWPKSIEDAMVIEREWRSMYELLIPHLHRARFMRASLADVANMVEPLRLLQLCELPHLEDLELIFPRPSYVRSRFDGDKKPLGKGWNILPQTTPLLSLKFSDPTRYLPEILDVPWPTLSTLDLEVHIQWWPKLCSTLSQLPALLELRLYIISPRIDTSSQGTEPTKPRYSAVLLPLVERVTTNDLAIWHDISTPALSSISITYTKPYSALAGPTQGVDRTAEGLLRTLAGGHVREVIFTGCTLKADEALFPLRAFASVEHLRFNHSYSNWKVLEPLAEERENRAQLGPGQPFVTENEIILPSLKRVSIEESKNSFPAAVDTPKTQAVVSRLRAVSIDVTWTLESVSWERAPR